MSDEERPPVELEHVQLHSATTTSASSPAFEPPRVRSFTAPCPLQHEEQKTVKSPIETLMIDTQTEPVTETPEIQVEQVNAYAESNALSGAQEFATVEHPQVRQTGLLLQNELGDWFYWDAQGRPVLVPQVVISMNAPNAFIPGMSPLPASSPLQMDAAQNPAQEIQSQKTIYYIPPQTRNEQDPIVPGPQISFQPPAPTSPSQKKKRLSGLVASPKSQEEVPQFVYQEPPLPSVSLHPQYPQALKATQMNPESSATLIDSSVSDVLHENPKSYKESALSDILSAPSCPGQYGSGQPKRKRSRGGLWIQAFRIFNLLRAIATAIYSYKITADALNNHEMIRLGATSLLYVSFVTTTVDLIVPMIRLWPTLLWCFWDVKTWDPYSRTWTVWALILDHDLLIDVLPILVNVIVKIYMYRVSELIANPMIRDTITNPDIQIGSVSDFLKYQNFVLLMCFVASLVYTLLFHGVKLWHYLTFERRSLTLGTLAILKTVLLTFDLLTNGLLLYKVLVFKGLHLFDLSGLVAMTLSVVGPSPIITLSTNALVNLPMHYSNFRMRLRDIKTATKVHISKMRIWKASFRQTFHLSLSPLYMYAIYSTGALIYIMVDIREVSSISVQNLMPSSDFFGWNSSGTTRNVLVGMLWTNVVVNYLAGMTLWLLWLVWSFSANLCYKSGQ